MRGDTERRIPVVDLFAGPGGLAEGFSAFDDEGRIVLKICLSAEKDQCAHSTLELRTFFRQFPRDHVPEEYYLYLRKEISREELFSIWQEVRVPLEYVPLQWLLLEQLQTINRDGADIAMLDKYLWPRS